MKIPIYDLGNSDSIKRQRYLSRKLVDAEGIESVTIINSARMVEQEYRMKDDNNNNGNNDGVKRVMKCVCRVKAGNDHEYVWVMNTRTRNHMIRKFGGDSEAWVDKVIEIKIDGGIGEYKGVYPKALEFGSGVDAYDNNGNESHEVD